MEKSFFVVVTNAGILYTLSKFVGVCHNYVVCIFAWFFYLLLNMVVESDSNVSASRHKLHLRHNIIREARMTIAFDHGIFVFINSIWIYVYTYIYIYM